MRGAAGAVLVQRGPAQQVLEGCTPHRVPRGAGRNRGRGTARALRPSPAGLPSADAVGLRGIWHLAALGRALGLRRASWPRLRLARPFGLPPPPQLTTRTTRRCTCVS